MDEKIIRSLLTCFILAAALLQGHSGGYSPAAGSILLPGSGQYSFIPDRSSHHQQWSQPASPERRTDSGSNSCQPGWGRSGGICPADLARWGIGDKNKNNRVLADALEERKSRIEVGYGLEGALPDGKTGRIQDEHLIPYFQQGDYDLGW